MEIDNKNLAETFSAGSNDSDPSIGEIRKKIKQKKSRNDVTTYKVVAHITANKKIKILDRTLSKAEIDFIRSNFCK